MWAVIHVHFEALVLCVCACACACVCVCARVCVGGAIAASWAVLRCMGQEGYVEIARKLMEIADIMKTGINLIEVFF